MKPSFNVQNADGRLYGKYIPFISFLISMNHIHDICYEYILKDTGIFLAYIVAW